MQPIRAALLCQGLGTLPGDPLVTSVVTDSRAVGPGSLFVCIPGQRVDGHAYAAAALAAGAVGIVAQHPVEGVPAERCVFVPDPLDAMIALGANYRARYNPVLVGVTGSVGKTTTKEFCAAVFSAFGNTIKTLGNQNNEIGMPNTLFRLDDATRYAVVEMGMQGLGEIEKLTRAARPQGAIITWVGQSHLEQLGTRENILRAKLEICAGMSDGAPLVLNADNDLLPAATIPARLRRVTFGLQAAGADVRAVNLQAEGDSTRFTIQDSESGEYEAVIPALGRHNVADALSAWALATRLGLAPARAADALANYQTTGHRQNVVRHGGITLLEDCYNASPDSMYAALATLADYPVPGKRIALLGDMFELGTVEEDAHARLGQWAAQNKVDLLLTVGQATRATHTAAVALGVQAVHCAGKKQALAQLLQAARPGDAILVKASHGMALETLLADFYAAYPAEQTPH